MTPEQTQAWDMQQSGSTYADIAAAMGISRDAVKRRLRGARKWIEADPAAKVAAQVAGSHIPPHSFWLKTDTHSIYYKIPKDDCKEDILADIEDKFRDLPVVTLPYPVNDVSADKLVFYALADIHLGQLSWGEETGEDYDTDIASRRVQSGMADLVNAAPHAEQAIIVAIGDSLHANDDNAQTPQSKHSLDVDSRHYKAVDMAIEMFAAAVELAAQKHRKVTFCILPGNHDKDSYRAIMFAMRERYRLDDRINIVATPMEFFVHEFGKCMIACHHGDRAKATRLVLDAADRWPEMWGRTRHRNYFTGHLHHHKSEDIGGMTWTQLRAITAKDAYASGHSYSAKSQMVAYVFDKERGEVAQHKVNF